MGDLLQPGGYLLDIYQPFGEGLSDSRHGHLLEGRWGWGDNPWIEARHVVDNKYDNLTLRDISASSVRSDGVDTPCAHMLYMEFAFALRGHPDALPDRKATISGSTLIKSKPSSKSILCICDVMGANRLVLKLANRENDRAVSILMRPCFWKGSAMAPVELCPVYVFFADRKDAISGGRATFRID